MMATPSFIFAPFLTCRNGSNLGKKRLRNKWGAHLPVIGTIFIRQTSYIMCCRREPVFPTSMLPNMVHGFALVKRRFDCHQASIRKFTLSIIRIYAVPGLTPPNIIAAVAIAMAVAGVRISNPEILRTADCVQETRPVFASKPRRSWRRNRPAVRRAAVPGSTSRDKDRILSPRSRFE